MTTEKDLEITWRDIPSIILELFLIIPSLVCFCLFFIIKLPEFFEPI